MAQTCHTFFQSRPGYHVKRLLRLALMKQMITKNKERYAVYQKYEDFSYVGHTLAFKWKGFEIEQFEQQIREAFRFPELEADDMRNAKMLTLIRQSNSVAIHARRSDLLFVNGYCYRYGYFKRAVHYIKKRVKDPVFIFLRTRTVWAGANKMKRSLDLIFKRIRFIL